jgi:two-component system chemotaxis response regulator CheB
VAGLPDGFPAAVLVVLHLYPHHKSIFADLLGRRTRLRVKEATDGEPIEPGTIYVARADMHLGVRDSHVALTSSGQVHFSRPSVDTMLESVAASYGDRAIGIVLSGTGFDGATGIRAIKEQGGTTIVQDPADAEHPGMPSNAWLTGCVDFKLPLDEITPLVVSLVLAGGGERRPR